MRGTEHHSDWHNILSICCRVQHSLAARIFKFLAMSSILTQVFSVHLLESKKHCDQILISEKDIRLQLAKDSIKSIDSKFSKNHPPTSKSEKNFKTRILKHDSAHHLHHKCWYSRRSVILEVPAKVRSCFLKIATLNVKEWIDIPQNGFTGILLVLPMKQKLSSSSFTIPQVGNRQRHFH